MTGATSVVKHGLMLASSWLDKNICDFTNDNTGTGKWCIIGGFYCIDAGTGITLPSTMNILIPELINDLFLQNEPKKT